MSKASERPASTGPCYGCRHADDAVYPNQHCRGTGDLEGHALWPGFICTCPCREDVDAAATQS